MRAMRTDTEVAKASSPVRPARSPGHAVPVDYFNVKPIRSLQQDSPHLEGGGGEASGGRVTPSFLPLKSPRDWLVSSSYGTQNSSSGSRGSSWANNLSTLFKTGTASIAGGRGTNTPPLSQSAVGGGSPASLSPAFMKRLGPLSTVSEGRKAGGISSNRPRATSGKVRTTTHVSFASDNDGVAPRSPASAVRSRGSARPLRVVISKLAKPFEAKDRSMILSDATLLRQLEYHKLLYADLLLRLGRSQERAQVLKLMRTSLAGPSTNLLKRACGIDDEGSSIALCMACRSCSSSLTGRSQQYCEKCRRKARNQLCVFCHLPLSSECLMRSRLTRKLTQEWTGLIETCLTCLHSCHLACLQEWRRVETGCPAACPCQWVKLGRCPKVVLSFSLQVHDQKQGRIALSRSRLADVSRFAHLSVSFGRTDPLQASNKDHVA